MKFIIEKTTRTPGDVSYSGGSWDGAGIRNEYRDQFDKFEIAYKLANKLSEYNEIGFEVYPVAKSTDVFFCVRFYPSMEAKYTVRDAKGLKSWLDFNIRNRGNALFVNNHCQYPCFMEPYDVQQTEVRLFEYHQERVDALSKPWQEAEQYERHAPNNRRYGYPDDRYLTI